MNEPLREAIANDINKYFSCNLSVDNNRFVNSLMQLFRTTLTDLQAEMPTVREQKLTSSVGGSYGEATSRFYRDGGHNFAVQQQQAAFKKVLEGMK